MLERLATFRTDFAGNFRRSGRDSTLGCNRPDHAVSDLSFACLCWDTHQEEVRTGLVSCSTAVQGQFWHSRGYCSPCRCHLSKTASSYLDTAGKQDLTGQIVHKQVVVLGSLNHHKLNTGAVSNLRRRSYLN